MAVVAVLHNSLVTWVGWRMWCEGYIVFRQAVDATILLDILVLFVGMDLAMYIFHRLAHHP